ncbi:hypothetical protein RFI_10018 [Reticulomyxa filosa]|uniref:Uncharacterized protein n=1 Tax=Reticulomyxa filosa TaxID=46433 RepID=X6NMF2_RETFI|nr:hypothetical protein RFI_10018 [Reticulomyxa filosa]|eukprot:ETO27113.1 hypothetical protein RFI_10018 [Reticulomyxa filosa]
MIANFNWRSEHIENGNWVHSLGSEEYVLSTYHNQMEWKELPKHLTKSKNATNLGPTGPQSNDFALSSDKKFAEEMREAVDEEAESGNQDEAVGRSNNEASGNENASIHNLHSSKELEQSMLDEFDIQLKTISLDAESHSNFFDFEVFFYFYFFYAIKKLVQTCRHDTFE